MAQDPIIGKLTCYKTIEFCWVCPKMSTSVAFESLDEKGQRLVRDRDLARQPFLVVRCFPIFSRLMCTSNIIRNFTCQLLVARPAVQALGMLRIVLPQKYQDVIDFLSSQKSARTPGMILSCSFEVGLKTCNPHSLAV